ncbi:MAG: putative amidophosphoribosyltransferase [Candidatus Paceibacteria bacterium]|jgi:predicted amidophosphoribosyltransferase
MHDQWKLLCNTLWPEPELQTTQLPKIQPGLFKKTNFLLSYKKPTVKTCIRNNKFHFHTKSAKSLAEVVDHFFSRYPEAIIIPVPSSNNRERKRGYQHLLNILQYSQHRNQVRIDILKKQTDTLQQSHVSKEIRLLQQVGSFYCQKENLPISSQTIILFDDVVTTEATMSAAQTTLATSFPTKIKIICFAIAH